MDPHTERVALGRLVIDFSGRDFIAGAAMEEIRYQDRGRGACTGSLSFLFGATAATGDDTVQIDRFLVGGGSVRVRDPYLPHSLRWDGPVLEVSVESVPGFWRRRPVASATKLVDQSFNDAARRLSKRFYYTIFDQAVQIAQVPLGQSWVHSSAVTNGDRTVLFMAWGGVGKTSALLKMLETGAWRFLADDLAALDEDGMVYRSPQRMQVYASNVAGQKELRKRILNGRSEVDRLHWEARRRILGPRSVRRRMHPEEMFGPDSVAVSGRVTDAVYIRRTSSSSFQLDVSTPRDLARLGTAVLQAELTPLDRWLVAIHSAAPSQEWPTTDEMSRDTGAVIESGLTKAAARCVIVGVPSRCGPDDLLRFVQSQVLT